MTCSKHSVVVIGGGPAGATLAALLAKKDRDVLLLEREQFPREHIGESLITGMMSIIEELGLTERIEQMGFEHKRGISLVWGDDPTLWDAQFADAGAYEHSYHVRRSRFDAMLLDRARELGVQVREQAKVLDAVRDGERTVGVRYSMAGSDDVHQAHADYVVDASGQSRVLARRLTGTTWQDDLRNAAVSTYYEGYHRLPEGQGSNILVESVEKGWFWGIPLSDSVLSVGFVTAIDTVSAAPGTPQELFESQLEGSQIMRGLLADAVRSEPWQVNRDWSHVSTSFTGDGWLTVGDAAVFIDPLFSSGVWLGMSGAWLAARSLDAVLGHPSLEDRAFAAYDVAYRQLAQDILGYVRYFYDPTRAREDYLQRAQSAARVVTEQSKVGFVAMISGVHALPDLAAFDPAAGAVHVGAGT